MEKFSNPEIKVEKLDFSINVVTDVSLPPHFNDDE